MYEMYTKRFWFVTGVSDPLPFRSLVTVRLVESGSDIVSETVKFSEKSSTSPV